VFSFPDLGGELTPRQRLTVVAARADGQERRFEVQVRLDTPVDVVYWKNGGILHTVLRALASTGR